MSLVKGMRSCGGGVLVVCRSALTGMCAETTGGGIGGNVSARFAKVVRAGIGVGTSLVCGYLAGAIGTKFKCIERGFSTKC